MMTTVTRVTHSCAANTAGVRAPAALASPATVRRWVRVWA